MTAGPPASSSPPARPLPALEHLATLLTGAILHRDRRVLGRGRRSAVLIVLFARDGDVRMILTKRSERLAHHRGQVSLPGGRWEESDPDLVTTALRETAEEVGIPADTVTVIGAIDDVHTVATDFVITPVVGTLPAPPRITPSVFEIARVMEVSLGELLALDAAMPDGLGPLELRYPLDGEDVWGATARILRDFARIVRTALGDPSAALRDLPAT